MASFKSAAGFQDVLQRKALNGFVLVAPYSEDWIDDICIEGGELDFPETYERTGKITSDGVTFGGDVEKQEDRHWGDIGPSRIDIESEDVTLEWTAAETNRVVMELSHGVDLDGVTPDAITGTIKYDKPPLPAVVDRRVIAVFLDRNKSNGLEIYWAIGFPRANVTRNGEQELQKEEGGLS